MKPITEHRTLNDSLHDCMFFLDRVSSSPPVRLLVVVSQCTLPAQPLAQPLPLHMCPVLVVWSPPMELQDMSHQRLHPSVLASTFLMTLATILMLWVAVLVLS
jgi:hypothetical protein